MNTIGKCIIFKMDHDDCIIYDDLISEEELYTTARSYLTANIDLINQLSNGRYIFTLTDTEEAIFTPTL